MIEFKEVRKFEYIKEYDSHILIDSLFYTAYKAVFKELVALFPDDTRLEELEVEKPYHSFDMKMPKRAFVNIERRAYPMESCVVEEVPVTQLMFDIMEIIPYFYKYNFYQRVDYGYGESIFLEVPLGGRAQTGGVTNYQFPQDVKKLKESFTRDLELESFYFYINHTQIYLALVGHLDEQISNKEIESFDDYFDNLKLLTKDLVEELNEIQISKDFFNTRFASSSNEGRVSFIDFLKPKVYPFEELLKENYNQSRRRFNTGYSFLNLLSYRRRHANSLQCAVSSPLDSEQETIEIENILNQKFEELEVKEDYLSVIKRNPIYLVGSIKNFAMDSYNVIHPYIRRLNMEEAM